MSKNTKELEAIQKAIEAMTTTTGMESELELAKREIEELHVRNRMMSEGLSILANENCSMRRKLRAQNRILNEIGRYTSIAELRAEAKK